MSWHQNPCCTYKRANNTSARIVGSYYTFSFSQYYLEVSAYKATSILLDRLNDSVALDQKPPPLEAVCTDSSSRDMPVYGRGLEVLPRIEEPNGHMYHPDRVQLVS